MFEFLLIAFAMIALEAERTMVCKAEEDIERLMKRYEATEKTQHGIVKAFKMLVACLNPDVCAVLARGDFALNTRAKKH